MSLDPSVPTAALAAGAVAVALSSRGEILLLALLLAALAWRPVAAAALLLAALATAVRWGDGSLEAIAGGQSVLGPAATVQPVVAAASAVLGAAAVLLVAGAPVGPPPMRALAWLAVGATAAVIAAGPGPGDRMWLRVASTVGLTAVALVITRLRRARPRLDRFVDLAALVAAVAALGCGLAAPADWAWRGRDTLTSLAEGALVAVAAAAIGATVAAMGSQPTPLARLSRSRDLGRPEGRALR